MNCNEIMPRNEDKNNYEEGKFRVCENIKLEEFFLHFLNHVTTA